MGQASRRRVAARTALDTMTSQRRVTAVEAAAVSRERTRANVMGQLGRVLERRAALEAKQRELVDQARQLGVEWAVIGAALGVTPQAVQKRYGSRPALGMAGAGA